MQDKSKIDELLEKQKIAAEKEKKMIEDMKLVCKEIFLSTNGKFFLKYLKKIMLLGRAGRQYQ